CVPCCMAAPRITSSTSAGSTRARSSAARMACAAIVGASRSFRAPRYALPMGVRAVETMTASRMTRVCQISGSILPQRCQGLDAQGAARRDGAGQARDAEEEPGHRRVGPRIVGADLEEQGAEAARRGEGQAEPERRPGADEDEAAADDQPQDARPPRAQG